MSSFEAGDPASARDSAAERASEARAIPVATAGDPATFPALAEEIRRRIMPVNHYRAIDAARLLGFASLSCHTPADNAVAAFIGLFHGQNRGKMVVQLA